MSSQLFPDIKKSYTKDFHKENKEKMKMREQETKQKIEDEKANAHPKQEWKMKRFQSVEAKVRNGVPVRKRFRKTNNHSFVGEYKEQPWTEGKSKFVQIQFIIISSSSNVQSPIQMENQYSKAVLNQNQSNVGARQPQRHSSQNKMQMNGSMQHDQYDYQIPNARAAGQNNHTDVKQRMANKTALLQAAMAEEFQISRVVIYDDTKLVSIEDTKVPLYSAPVQQPKANQVGANKPMGLPPKANNKTQRLNEKPGYENNGGLDMGIGGQQIGSKLPSKPPKAKQTTERARSSQRNYDEEEKRPQTLTAANLNSLNTQDGSKQPRNYVKDNKAEALNPNKGAAVNRKLSQQGPTSQQQQDPHHKDFGKVPKYIEKYQRQKEDEAEMRRRQEEESKLPPGTRLMPEEERLRTLEDLQSTKKELINALERMPVANQSMALQKRIKEMEEKINKLDKAISTFSRKTVYVAI